MIPTRIYFAFENSDMQLLARSAESLALQKGCDPIRVPWPQTPAKESPEDPDKKERRDRHGKKIYDSAKGRAGEVAQIIQVMSLRPQPLATFMRFYTQLMMGETTLSRAEKELLATVTSAANSCHY